MYFYLMSNKGILLYLFIYSTSIALIQLVNDIASAMRVQVIKFK